MRGGVCRSASSTGCCAMNASEDAVVDAFCDALWLEDGLARNTLDSYRRDLAQFQAWMRQRQGSTLLAAANTDIQSYLGHKFRSRTKATTAGRLLSSLRRFYRYALRQN